MRKDSSLTDGKGSSGSTVMGRGEGIGKQNECHIGDTFDHG